MKLQPIIEQINEEIREEFIKISQDFKSQLERSNLIKEDMKHLENLFPATIREKSKLLSETLINYLLKNAKSDLVDIKMQNEFYRKDFRKSLSKKYFLLEKEKGINDCFIVFSNDQRYIYAGISSIIVLVMGLSLLFGIAQTFAIAFLTGVPFAFLIIVLTIICSIIAYKKTFDKTMPITRKKFEMDIEQSIQNAEIKILSCLKELVSDFKAMFEEFCISQKLNF